MKSKRENAYEFAKAIHSSPVSRVALAAGGLCTREERAASPCTVSSSPRPWLCGGPLPDILTGPSGAVLTCFWGVNRLEEKKKNLSCSLVGLCLLCGVAFPSPAKHRRCCRGPGQEVVSRWDGLWWRERSPGAAVGSGDRWLPRE